MATFTGNFSELLSPGLLDIIGTSFRARDEEYSKILNVRTSRRNFETVLKVAGLGLAQAKTEGDSITFDDPLQGSTITVSFTTYALGVSISWEAMSDDLYNFLPTVGNELGDSLRETVEVLAMAPFNLAFDAGTTLIDGVALCSDSHPRLDGGPAQDNLTTATLGLGSLRDALIVFEKYKNDRGKQIKSMANRLLVSPDNMFLVQEIFGSANKPFTANNEINVLRGELTPVISHYMENLDDWFILGDKHSVDFYWRVRPVFRSFDDQATLAAKFTSAMRIGVRAWDWPGVYGSTSGT